MHVEKIASHSFYIFHTFFVNALNVDVSAKTVESGGTTLVPIEEENEVQPQWCMYQDTLTKSNKTLIKEKFVRSLSSWGNTRLYLIPIQL